jgi:hypothetical protein
MPCTAQALHCSYGCAAAANTLHYRPALQLRCHRCQCPALPAAALPLPTPCTARCCAAAVNALLCCCRAVLPLPTPCAVAAKGPAQRRPYTAAAAVLPLPMPCTARCCAAASNALHCPLLRCHCQRPALLLPSCAAAANTLRCHCQRPCTAQALHCSCGCAAAANALHCPLLRCRFQRSALPAAALPLPMPCSAAAELCCRCQRPALSLPKALHSAGPALQLRLCCRCQRPALPAAALPLPTLCAARCCAAAANTLHCRRCTATAVLRCRRCDAELCYRCQLPALPLPNALHSAGPALQPLTTPCTADVNVGRCAAAAALPLSMKQPQRCHCNAAKACASADALPLTTPCTAAAALPPLRSAASANVLPLPTPCTDAAAAVLPLPTCACASVAALPLPTPCAAAAALPMACAAAAALPKPAHPPLPTPCTAATNALHCRRCAAYGLRCCRWPLLMTQPLRCRRRC